MPPTLMRMGVWGAIAAILTVVEPEAASCDRSGNIIYKPLHAR